MTMSGEVKRRPCDDGLVEAVARAIYESQFADKWIGGKGIEAELFRQSARAAIELTRPTTVVSGQLGSGDPNYLQPDDAFIERIFAEVDAETAEIPPMDARQIAYAIRCVRKALSKIGMRLSPSDFDALIKVLDHPPQPNEALKELMGSDMVERVANAAMACLRGYAGITISPHAALHVGKTALEASHHAELTRELAALRRAIDKFERRMKTDGQVDTDFALIARSLMEDLAKIGARP